MYSRSLLLFLLISLFKVSRALFLLGLPRSGSLVAIGILMFFFCHSLRDFCTLMLVMLWSAE